MVSIISILASIAVPNFLEAQTRAKVSRVKADMKTMITAIELYQVDNNRYPERRKDSATDLAPSRFARPDDLSRLTTPISYITTVPIDVFERIILPPNNLIDYYSPSVTAQIYNHYVDLKGSGQDPNGNPWSDSKKSEQSGDWWLVSVGPDGFLDPFSPAEVNASDYLVSPDWPTSQERRGLMFLQAYDPTNGTVSDGNIFAGSKGGVGGAGEGIRQFMEILYPNSF